jgi:hypothetical protein
MSDIKLQTRTQKRRLFDDQDVAMNIFEEENKTRAIGQEVREIYCTTTPSQSRRAGEKANYLIADLRRFQIMRI